MKINLVASASKDKDKGKEKSKHQKEMLDIATKIFGLKIDTNVDVIKDNDQARNFGLHLDKHDKDKASGIILVEISDVQQIKPKQTSAWNKNGGKKIFITNRGNKAFLALFY